ncbi:SEC7 domain-containing protein [Meloidogyne graminicola]|uniref:SEC7 domain-containing protein n=1 Tax=Meloidogyne graminicola TaxID=189291 RepID=A0A8S9ZXJ9_9BILA|nr:SEC7 domain-containing protein [Meloidogyne graminicola]
MFLKASIERILTDAGTRRKENAELRKACEEALDQLNSELQTFGQQQTENGMGHTILPNGNNIFLADRYFPPFELACHSKSTKIVINALDSLQKLISYGHLIGNQPDIDNPEQLLIDRVVQAICAPFQGPHTDDAVQLQIIKGILALILNQTCRIHESSLLLAVRTCFNIYLASKSPINQSTAKGILTQTINYVFTNMERSVTEVVPFDENNVVKDVLDSVVYQVSTSIDSCQDENSADQDQKSTNIDFTEPLSPNEQNIILNGSIHSSTPSYYYGVNGSSDNTDLNVTANGGTPKQLQQPKLEFNSIEEKDAFLIFRALCKLSMKHLPDDQDPKSHELRSKILSLEMILLVMEHINGHPLPDHHSFVYAIRHFLCVALTQNAVSPTISVFEKALSIIVQLINKWKLHLKKQLEVFFKEILLSILESPSSSFEHKWAVLNALSKIFDDSQSVVDIYVNYDCHMTSANIFEELISHLAKIASSYSSDPSSPTHGQQIAKEREKKMRELALKCLVKALKCLVVWYEEMEIGKEVSIQCPTEEQQQNLQLSSDGSTTQIVQVKQQKSLIESGIDLFAKKPSQGLAFLHSKGFIGKEPEDIASFFHAEERLDKSVIGDYLGDGDVFNQKVMYSYVDSFDFSGVNIVQALRTLLNKFRLPGEAQKIDRIMEKFASRYCDCNPQLKIFASADTAYVLSYSIIMLTTDLHNPQVKQELMVKMIYLMNSFLKYMMIFAANEIKTKPGNLKRPKLNAETATIRQRKIFQNLELQSISQVAHSLMEAATFTHVEFTTAKHFEQVQLMFELIWSFCLAAFSIGLQSSEDPAIWRSCLQGFSEGVRVACLFRLTVQREAFVQALTKFTLLTANSSLSEMRPKNVETIKLLIQIGVENGNYLEQCWYDVLKCISQLELVQSISTGNHDNVKSLFNIREKSIHAVQNCLDETSSQDVVVAIDRIFQDSSKLTGDAIIQFVRALCQVSLEELCSPGGPSMFMLQKIVEISFYNMNRIRIEWSMIWNVLGEHFNLAGCSSNGNISHFALEALRQLSMKFLEKGELPNFRFQKEFLHPFEVIMDRNRSLACREMIVTCVTHMVHSHADKIRSGWKNIFSLFSMAAAEKDERIVEQAFTTTSEIIGDVFPKYFADLSPDSFHDAIKCLSGFACNPAFPDTSMESIRLIRLAAALVDKHSDLINATWGNNSGRPESFKHLSNTNEGHPIWIKGWLPIIFELSCIVNRCKLDVRTRSLTVLFELVKSYGAKFGDDAWSDFFKIIFRIFDFGKIDELGNETTGYLKYYFDDFVLRKSKGKENNNIKQNINISLGKFMKHSVKDKGEFNNIKNNIWRRLNKEQIYSEELGIFLLNLIKLSENKNEWMITTCNHALYAIVDVFSEYYASLGPLLLPEVYKQLFWCVEQGNELLARSAINCLENLVVSNGNKFNKQMWDQTTEQIIKIFDCSIVDVDSTESLTNVHPVKSTIASSTGSSPNDESCGSFEDCVLLSSITRCIIQLEVVDAVSNILFGRKAFKVEPPAKRPSVFAGERVINGGEGQSEDSFSIGELPAMFQYLSTQNLMCLADALLKSHSMARRLSSNSAAQRNLLWKATFKGRSKPNMQKLEAHSIHCALNILFQLYAQCSSSEIEILEMFRKQLERTVKYALEYYLTSHSDTFRSSWLTGDKGEERLQTKIVQMILNRTCDLPNERFNELSVEFKLSLISLIESDEQPIIRSALHRVVQRFITLEQLKDFNNNLI